MSEIRVEKPTKEEMKRLDLPSEPQHWSVWAPWECEPSTFDWQYSDTEVAYIYEGKVKVSTQKGEVTIANGDLVTFPKGLKCTWKVLQKVRKVYKFE